MDLEPGRQRGGCGGGHGFGHGKGTDPLGAVVLGRDFRRFHDGARGWPARADDDTRTLVGDLVLFQAGVGDRLLHGDMVPRAALVQEAHGAAIHQGRSVERGLAPDLAAKAVLGERIRKRDARTRVAERGRDFFGIVADRGNDPQAGYDHSSHDELRWRKPKARRNGIVKRRGSL